jgi:hypothetical protein
MRMALALSGPLGAALHGFFQEGFTMIPRLFAAIVALTLSALPVAAAEPPNCAQQLKTVDGMLAKNPALPPDQMAQAKKFRDQGEMLMKGGKTRECRYAFTRAEKILTKGLKKK